MHDTGVDGASCVVLRGNELPVCYDKFTTNYFLPDGSTGSLAFGTYNSSAGHVNLITGDFKTSKGDSGNIYAEHPEAKPNIAALTLPTQFTAAGVGSAIPATELGWAVETAGAMTKETTTTASSTETGATLQSGGAASAAAVAAAAAGITTTTRTVKVPGMEELRLPGPLLLAWTAVAAAAACIWFCW